METAKLFMTGRSQAVRLPKDYRFEGTEVFIKRVGEAVVLLPQESGWDILERSLGEFEPGFRMEREQPERQQRRVKLKR
ncbi:MAG: type II toxin-antitoxin system VapB family antitoxin [Burkholderiales bacterium]